MGHLLSRALRRITHCANRANQQEQNQRSTSDEDSQPQQTHQQTQEKRPPVIAQSIPVGQSIDSAEFRDVLDSNKKSVAKGPLVHEETKKPDSLEKSGRRQDDSKENRNTTKSLALTDEINKPDVEEAVIKIQAFVRGHLTRKALKDAQHHSMPTPNALGQSQFDEESLTKNPPSTIFLSSLPLNLNNGENLPSQLNPGIINTTSGPLESIAEVTETTVSSTNKQQEHNDSSQLNSGVKAMGQKSQTPSESNRKLSPLNTRSASSPSKVDIPLPERNESITESLPPSEVNASIDLTCQTPASASIDIMDHNIKPIDKMATVLHLKENKKQEDIQTQASINQELLVTAYMEPVEEDKIQGEQHSTVHSVEITKSPDSYESEEAAAIRIQSAFRGYRTRKNSPYRTRSPNSFNAQVKRNALVRQQQTNVLHESDDVDVSKEKDKTDKGDNEKPDLLMDPSEQLNAIEKAQTEGRRQSRPRQRESSPVIQTAPSVDEFTTTEDTVKEALKMTGIQLGQDDEMLVQQSSKDGTVVREKSQSLDVTGNSLSEPAANDTSNEMNLSAALEVGSQSTNNDTMDGQAVLQVRETPGKESEASMEFDTDSSQLGAALSFNESEDASELQPQQSTASAPPLLDPIDEMDGSVGLNISEELDLEAKRLVDELESVEQETEVSKENEATQQDERNECALEEATNELESVLYAATGGIQSLLLDDDEQRAIELESDDIERRDPRGHVSEDRNSKSPLTRTEQPVLYAQEQDEDEEEDGQDAKGGELVEDEDDENPPKESLRINPMGLDEASGCSSPALHSSANVSSDEDNSDREDSNGDQQQHNQQQQQQPHQGKAGGGKNKKRNRNKKRNKK